MLIIEVKKGNIEKALKLYKSKVIRTKQLKKLRDNQQYIKPSETKRKQMAKAKYIQTLKDQTNY